MGFLGQLADQISNQFSLGENTNTLDAVIDGQNVKYGSLGDFAQKFDQSAERRYVEEGYLRKDPYNTDPKLFEILMQEPNATVLIKKKMFSSVGDNFRPDFMDADEKLYYKAMRILFQNKCRQIATLEKLSKIQKITSSVGSIHDQLVPIIISLTDTFNNGLSSGSDLFGSLGSSSNPFSTGGGTNDASSFTKIVDRLRRIYAFNATNPITTWITDDTNLFQSQFGQGTGVIEITNFTNLSTMTSTEINNPGNFSLTIVDPYESMLITEYDIEKAISDATNMFFNSKIFQFGKESSDQLINDLQLKLNQYRAARNASPISIKVSPDTLFGKRVTAIFDRLGISIPFDYDSTSAASILSGGAFGKGVSIAPEYLQGGAIAGNDGLSSQKQPIPGSSVKRLTQDSELSIFNRLISTIYSKLTMNANSQNAFQLNNKLTNYARRKLRFNFCGKLVIQPMDSVHIYVNSKSRYDSKLLTGVSNMFSGLGVLQNLNNTLTDFKQSVDALFNPSGNIGIQLEKSAFVGSDFPNYLWNLVRGQFVTEKEGTHVFAGVVEGATDNWTDGKFMIDVRGKDNTIYFDQGKINFKPGVDVFNGAIFDPLTPFKSNFDTIRSSSDSTVPELLDENKYLLGTSHAGVADITGAALVKSKLGRYAGQLVNEKDIIQDRSFDPVTGRITKVFYAPDGLVYKWKEGIGVFTQFGSNLDQNSPGKVGTANTFKEPFAGQDIMNVLSLSITGVPYNFATYFKTNLDSFNRDPQSKQDAAHSFAASLRNDLNKTNTLWGNFIPFKTLVIDEASYSKALQKQTTIIQKNKDLDDQIKKLQELNNSMLYLGAASFLAENTSSPEGAPPNPNFINTKSQIEELRKQINNNISALSAEDESYTQQTGDDTSFDINAFIDPDKVGKAISDGTLRRQLRRKLNYLTRRMSYNVRANEDKNLFIVDDFYDKDFDILAYEQSLTDGIRLYNNEFTSVREKIMNTAGLLNLEVFCDTQGHVRVRPPQYNRMPSSVFYKMLYLKKSLNIQIFPQFLDDLFSVKLETLKTRLEILEDQIRLDCAVLGVKNNYNSNTDSPEESDQKYMGFILNEGGFTPGTRGSIHGIGDSFAFISDANTGEISEIKNLLVAANPDQRDASLPQDLTTFDQLKTQSSSNKDVFNNSQKYAALVSALKSQELNEDGIAIQTTPQFLADTRVDDLISRIQTKSGQKINKSDYLVKTSTQVVDIQAPIGVAIDAFKVVQDLSDKIRERQKVLKLFYSTIKNAEEFKSLDANDSTVGNQLLTPGNFGNSNIPEVFEHMIEDETYDDYGLYSGKRFVIKRTQIRSISISENPPTHTAIEVRGILNPFAPNALPEGLNSFPSGGNGLVTAFAVDYDMWRNYGFKEPAVLTVPFLSDPISQCGPYASMLLSRNRKNILRGTVTISGNEFMQPGEVVFLEDRGLLFYVTSVKHNFAFGATFTTTLELTYGHTPGEYIPTVMDMIGKMIYNNKDVADLVVHRQDTSGNDISVGIIQKGVDQQNHDTNTVISSGKSDSTINSFAASNSQTINNILYTTAYLINANSTQGNDVTATIELRIYSDDKNPADSDLRSFADDIRNILIGRKSFKDNNDKDTSPTLPESSVKVIEKSIVNLDDINDRRSPSQKAFDASRNQVANRGMSGLGASSPNNNSDGGTGVQPSDPRDMLQKDKIRAALFRYIVDCWISIDPVPPQTSNGS